MEPRAPSKAETDLPSSARRRSILAVSAAALGIGATLGFMPGFIATVLRGDLDISRGQVGLLVSLYFGCTGLGSVMGGRLTERLGARLVVCIDMVSVAFAAFFSLAVGEYWALLAAACLGGTGYALANAGTNVAIGRAVPAHRRTLAMALKTSGVPAMAVMGAALGPYSAERWGWRSIWVVVGIAATVAAVAAWVVLDDDRPDSAAPVGDRSLPPGFGWFPVSAFLLIAGSQPLYSWVVPYVEQSLDSSAAVAGGVSAIASAVGGIAMVFSSVSTDRLGADRRVPRLVLLLAVNGIGTTMVLLGASVGVGLVLAGAVLGIAAQLSAIATMHAAVVDRAPRAVARATGLTMTGYYLGALFSPAAFGALVDVTGTFTYSWVATISLLLLAIPAWLRAGEIPIGTQHS